MPKKKKAKAKPKARRPKVLSAILFTYVEPANAKYARKQGKDPKFKTFSAFMNYLIAKDRGVKARGLQQAA